MEPVDDRSRTRGWSPPLVLWIPLAILGWAGVIWLGATLYATDPRTAGFDLELLLAAGRDVAAGLSPYDPAMVSGAAPAAPSLFYSYPPPVAQATSLLASIPSGVILVASDVLAVAGLLGATELLRRQLAPERPRRSVLLPVLAVAPFVFPFTIGLLFGNADVFFPFLYGLMLAGALADTRGGYLRAGVAVALASLKLHPASLGLWFAGRGLWQRSSGRRPSAWLAVGAAVAAVLAILAVSLLAGAGPAWSEYVAVVRTGSGADIVDPRNAGPAAVIVGLFDGDAAAARLLQVPITLVALVVTFVVAARHDDVIEGFSVAAVASLVTLPVTWYHYPAALMPVAIAAILRARGTRVRPTVLLVAGAGVIATIAVVWLPLLWVAIALVPLAARTSRSEATRPVLEGAGPSGG